MIQFLQSSKTLSLFIAAISIPFIIAFLMGACRAVLRQGSVSSSANGLNSAYNGSQRKPSPSHSLEREALFNEKQFFPFTFTDQDQFDKYMMGQRSQNN